LRFYFPEHNFNEFNDFFVALLNSLTVGGSVNNSWTMNTPKKHYVSGSFSRGCAL
jgi:hypothetical protein